MTSTCTKYCMHCLEKVLPTESNFGTRTYIICWRMCHVHIQNGLIQHLLLMRVSIWCFTDNWDMSWLSSRPTRQTGTRLSVRMAWPGSVPGAILITPCCGLGSEEVLSVTTSMQAEVPATSVLCPRTRRNKRDEGFFWHKRIKWESSWNSSLLNLFLQFTSVVMSLDMYSEAHSYFEGIGNGRKNSDLCTFYCFLSKLFWTETMKMEKYSFFCLLTS